MSKMIKFEVYMTPEMMIEAQEAKDEHERQWGQGYLSWDRFITHCILDSVCRIVAHGQKLEPFKKHA